MLWTNRGKFLLLDWVFRGTPLPDSFYVALITADDIPTVDTNLFSELTEITEGNGYDSGGFELDLDASAPSFDVLTEDDANDRAIIQVKDVFWEVSSGGTIPASGNVARYAILTDSTGESGEVVSERQVLAVWDLIDDRYAADGETFTLTNLELRAVEPD